MADTTWRALVREAEAGGDGAAWLRAALALTRAGRDDDAGRAALHAALAGADSTDVLDGLAPPLDAFTLRSLGDRFGLGRLSQAAWSACGAHVYVSQQGEVLRFGARDGARDTVAALPGHVTALAIDPSDTLLAAGVLDPTTDMTSLVTVDLVTGARRVIGRGHATIRELVVTHDLVVSAERRRVRAYERDASPTARSVWSMKGAATLDRSGAMALLPLDVSLQDAPERFPLVRDARDRGVTLTAAEPHASAQVVATAGQRTAIFRALDEPRFDLLQGGGEVLAGTPLASVPAIYSLALSPSGRHVALTHRMPHGFERTTTTSILDLLTGARRAFDIDARPRDPVWSPSGRRVAFPTDQGVLAVLEAPSGGEVEPAATAHEHAWVELRSPRQFWRGRVNGCTVEYHHGRLGAAGQRGAVVCEDAARAARELERRRREKERGGYVVWTPGAVHGQA